MFFSPKMAVSLKPVEWVIESETPLVISHMACWSFHSYSSMMFPLKTPFSSGMFKFHVWLLEGTHVYNVYIYTYVCTLCVYIYVYVL